MLTRNEGELPMSHPHEGEHVALVGSRPLIITLAIVAGVMVVEIIGGLLSNSLALLSDAGHMLLDALALGLSLFAINLARRPSTPTRTYGYHRVEIIAALANGSTLVLVSAFIFYEAYQRFLEPPEVKTPLMLLVAGIGLVANLSGIIILRRGSRGTLNVKAAFWHILGDTISSVGVIAGGVIITFTGWRIVDPIIAVVIGLIILWGSVRLVRDSVDILMESVPKHIQIEQVLDALKSVSGVEDVHDIHVWTITSGINALSAHLMIRDQMVSRSAEVVEAVNHRLSDRFNITHTTLQIECAKCESCPSGIICNISRPENEEPA